MQFILTGFTHDVNFRVFAFECVGKDKVGTDFTVRADLLLARKYGIRIQELPLLCREILERQDVSDLQQMLTYAEADMSLHADACSQRANAQKNRYTKRPEKKYDSSERGPTGTAGWNRQ